MEHGRVCIASVDMNVTVKEPQEALPLPLRSGMFEEAPDTTF